MKKIGKISWIIIVEVSKLFLKILCIISKHDYTQVMLESFLQFVKFGIVGLTNTIISYVSYAGTLLIFKKNGIFNGFDYMIAQVVGFVLSVLWSFFWNNKFVFQMGDGEHRSIWKALIKTFISYSFTGLFLNSILLILWVQMLHISEFIAPIVNLIISVPLNFIINKFWAFKSEKVSTK